MALAHRFTDVAPRGPHRSDIAWVFPGQGAQEVGMGRDVFDAFPEAQEIFERADRALGFSISRLCFEGPEEDLRATINAQPAIVTASIAYLAAARGRHELVDCVPSSVAGHSLGEYSALVAAGALSFEDGVRLVRERGRLMHAAGEINPGTMAAVLGLPEPDLASVCEETGAEICNLNGGGQIVIGGTKQAVLLAMDLARARGAAKVIPLNVSGAFHSSLMRPALEGMTVAVEQADLRDAQAPVIGNTTASAIANTEQVRTELLGQICTAVQWERSIQYMSNLGVKVFVEIGPGRALSGMIKRIAKGARTESINSAKTLGAAPATDTASD